MQAIPAFKGYQTTADASHILTEITGSKLTPAAIPSLDESQLLYSEQCKLAIELNCTFTDPSLFSKAYIYYCCVEGWEAN